MSSRLMESYVSLSAQYQSILTTPLPVVLV